MNTLLTYITNNWQRILFVLFIFYIFSCGTNFSCKILNTILYKAPFSKSGMKFFLKTADPAVLYKMYYFDNAFKRVTLAYPLLIAIYFILLSPDDVSFSLIILHSILLLFFSLIVRLVLHFIDTFCFKKTVKELIPKYKKIDVIRYSCVIAIMLIRILLN